MAFGSLGMPPRRLDILTLRVTALKKLRHSKQSMSANAFYEKVIKVKADVAAYLINCFPSA
jgi:hypothetical protein